jgi:hypothetical protein
METTNIYDYLHLLNLIKIRPNMDWGGGGFGICTYMSEYFFFPPFLLKKVEKGLQANTKLRGKKHTMAFIHLFVSFSFFKLGFN